MDPVSALAEAVERSTITYRKGDVVTQRQVGDVKVTEVNDFPPTPTDGTVVDLTFIDVGLSENPITSDEFRALIAAAVGHGSYPLTAEDLRGGPSYIGIGGWLGSQGLALCYIALGQLLGLWKAITPATLRIEGEEAAHLAGLGFVMAGPYDVDDVAQS